MYKGNRSHTIKRHYYTLISPTSLLHLATQSCLVALLCKFSLTGHGGVYTLISKGNARTFLVICFIFHRRTTEQGVRRLPGKIFSSPCNLSFCACIWGSKISCCGQLPLWRSRAQDRTAPDTASYLTENDTKVNQDNEERACWTKHISEPESSVLTSVSEILGHYRLGRESAMRILQRLLSE